MADSEMAMQSLKRIASVLKVPVSSFYEEPQTTNETDLDELRRIYAGLKDSEERDRLIKVTRSLFGKRHD